MRKDVSNFKRRSDGRLPHNRKELFFDVLKWQFTRLLSIGLLSLVFLLPHFATQIHYDIFASAIIKSTGDVAEKIITLRLKTSLMQVVTYPILFTGASGVAYLLRQLAWRKPFSVVGDCFRGIKRNWKHFLLLGVLTGVLNVINTFSEVMTRGFIKYIPTAVTVLLVVPTLLYSSVLDVVYDKKPVNLLSSAATLYLKTAPVTLLFTVFVVAPVILLFIQKFSLRYAIICAYTVIVMPIVLFAFTLYAMYNFDKYINGEKYPELYGRGLVENDSIVKKTEDE